MVFLCENVQLPLMVLPRIATGHRQQKIRHWFVGFDIENCDYSTVSGDESIEWFPL